MAPKRKLLEGEITKQRIKNQREKNKQKRWLRKKDKRNKKERKEESRREREAEEWALKGKGRAKASVDQPMGTVPIYLHSSSIN